MILPRAKETLTTDHPSELLISEAEKSVAKRTLQVVNSIRCERGLSLFDDAVADHIGQYTGINDLLYPIYNGFVVKCFVITPAGDSARILLSGNAPDEFYGVFLADSKETPYMEINDMERFISRIEEPKVAEIIATKSR